VLPTHIERIKPGDETKARIQVTLGEGGGKACRVKAAVKQFSFFL